MATVGGKKKIDVKSMAIGAGGLFALMLLPFVGDALSKAVAGIRNALPFGKSK